LTVNTVFEKLQFMPFYFNFFGSSQVDYTTRAEKNQGVRQFFHRFVATKKHARKERVF